VKETLGKIEYRFLKRMFPYFEMLGFHALPNHFYYPVPDTRRLKDDLWTRHSELTGIEMNESAQLDLLADVSRQFKDEYDQFPLDRTDLPYQYFINNGSFSSVDGEILYCMIRSFKPKRMMEIGSGFSTYLSAQAILKNQEEGQKGDLIAIEPYPNGTLKSGFPGLKELIPLHVQEVGLPEFDKLKENDVLFIDSSHTLRIGSDVQYEYLSILPRLKKGVIVHIHDIFLPAEYPRDWIFKEHWFWTEQYLLQALLTFSYGFQVLWAGSHMHLKHPEKLEKAFKSYDRSSRWPGSFWIKRI
jgi:predicted O-methyltransferase YrrM